VFLAIVAAEEPTRAGGHREALGWVLRDLHANRPLALGEDVAALTAVLAGTPELGKTVVAIAGFQPARIEYVPPGSRYVRWRHQWPGTAAELWDTAITVLEGTGP
jgi:hypothetical protein